MFDIDEWKELNLLEDAFDFDSSELHEPTDAETDFANGVFDLIQGLIDSESTIVTEEFTSRSNLMVHFHKHCIGNSSNRVSNRQNIYYDFTNVNQYKDYEDKLSAKIYELSASSKNQIGSLLDTEKLNRALRKLFEGNQFVIFPASCEFKRDGKSVTVVIHSFSSNVTKNYHGGNTVDLIIMSAHKKTVTVYPVDANYLENKLNNLILNYNSNQIRQIKINH